VANRGEIAVRVIRACQELGIPVVAVYSEADRFSPHVLCADEAVCVGPAPAAESYLNAGALIAAARETGATAIHPGYGFLAENPDFARRVEEAGLTFIGPPAAAIAEMGDKTAARARMLRAGVRVVPGSESPVTEPEAALLAAEAVGYPVLLKAVAGGGGKGMRVVESADEITRAIQAARREAWQAFGDERIYVERFLSDPRHIEFQVLADAEGQTIHLGERECSIQRRHQKLIEESPSPAIDEETRRRMGDVAVTAAREVGYVGAGTVEFLYQDGEFYFLEMNTRLQVEHPVTELVTGVDLVQAQIRIAAGQPLGIEPDGRWPVGHAIECRISGEDPYAGFFPSTGRIESLEVPSGPGVRWDGGIVEYLEVGLHYDPLLAKLIVHAPNRPQAIGRMRRALRELRIDGIRTTQPFHLAVMSESDFQRGDVSVSYIERHPDLFRDGTAEWQERAAGVAATLLEERARGSTRDVTTAAQLPAGQSRRSEWQRAFAPSESRMQFGSAESGRTTGGSSPSRK
jgi:acetyl-CoA carboxylase biotin carboxylase subunit